MARGFMLVNTPPAQAGRFGLQLKAGLIGHPADQAPPPPGESRGERIQ